MQIIRTFALDYARVQTHGRATRCYLSFIEEQDDDEYDNEEEDYDENQIKTESKT